MSKLDQWLTEYMMWREREPEACDDVILGVRSLELHAPTRALITDDFIFPLDRPVSTEEAREVIGAEALDQVSLADGVHVMLVDDASIAKGLRLNPLATGLYWQKCGRKGPWVIRGDVIIVPDSDYVKDEALRGMYE
jgi:hypothetical protein